MSKLTRDDSGTLIEATKPAEPQNVSVSGSAAHTTDFTTNDTLVRVESDVAVYFSIGPSAVALTTSNRLPEGSVEYFRVDAGDRISFLQVSGAGTAKVAICN